MRTDSDTKNIYSIYFKITGKRSKICKQSGGNNRKLMQLVHHRGKFKDLVCEGFHIQKSQSRVNELSSLLVVTPAF